MKPLDIISRFDKYLSERELRFSAIAIGGAALAILGVISRETQDCDILDPTIPREIADAALEFSKFIRKENGDLKASWLNNGPEDLTRILPDGWRHRLVKLFSGKSLTLFTLSRDDLLKTKLFAYCDRGQDLSDCIALNPSSKELLDALEWVQMQDANPGWPTHVEIQFRKLGEKLGHGI